MGKLLQIWWCSLILNGYQKKYNLRRVGELYFKNKAHNQIKMTQKKQIGLFCLDYFNYLIKNPRMVMKINRSMYCPRFRKTLLASLLVPLFSPLYSWAQPPVSVTDGTSLSISGLYTSEVNHQYVLTITGTGSEINGGSDVTIETTGVGAFGSYVADNGTLNLNGATIRTEDNVAYGIYNKQGTVGLQGSTITTNGQSTSGVNSSGVGSLTDINGSEITTNNFASRGVYGGAGAEIILNNTTLNASGSGSYGIYLENAGSTLTGANNIINNTNAQNGTGINIAYGGSSVILDNTTINMTNGGAGAKVAKGSSIIMDGLTATGNIKYVLDIAGNATVSNADINLDSGGALLALGDSASNQAVIILNNVNAVSDSGNVTMVDVNKNADITINGGSYYSKGNDAKGVWIRDDTSVVKINDAMIVTEGSNAAGIENRGTAIVDNTTVITKGNNAHGLYSQQGFDATNMTLSTAGTGSIGAAAAKGGNLNLNNAIINTTGDSGMVLGTFVSSSISAKNITGTSTGAGAYALWMNYDSSILLEDSEITARDQNAGGIYASGSSTGSAYTQATLNNATVISEQGFGAVASGANINIDVKNGSQLTGGNGYLLYAFSSTAGVASNVNLNGDNQAVLVGDIFANANNNIHLTLKNNSVWTGAASNAQSVDIDSSSIWNLTGDADIDSMHILGQMNFIPSGSGLNTRAPNSSFSTLTVNSNVTGSGSFTFNTQLGDSSSPTDRLDVIGNVTGDHGIVVINQGGLGALTTGSGINLITVVGDTQDSSFTLNNSVSAGAYEYFLYKIDESNWNLQSNLTGPVDPVDPPVDPTAPVDPTVPVDPTAPVDPGGETAYRPEVPGYIAAPWLNAFYGFTTLASLHERRGSAEGAAQGFKQDSWGRVHGQHNKFDAGRFSYDSNLWFMQLGHDFYQAENAAGTQVTAGMMVTLGKQSSDAQDKARGVRADLSVNTGKIKTDAYGLGGYYTLMTEEGGYLDIVSQATLYRNSYESQHNAKHNGYGVVMSAEVGQAYPLVGNWVVEPQGQLKYQYLHLSPKSFRDQVSEVSGTDYSVGQMRAGVRMFSDAAKQQDVKPYLTTDVIHQLGRNPEVTVATVSIRPDFTKTYWQGGAGVTAKMSDNVDLYADAKYQRSFDGKMEGYLGNLGAKISF